MSAEGRRSKRARRAYQARMVRSTAHPIRAKALSMMSERPTSPKEVAAALGKPIGNVVYHVSELEKAKMVILVEKKKRGGATEHFYLATTIDDAAATNLDPDQRETLALRGLHLIIADAVGALEAGLLGSRPDIQIARIPLRLDERGWNEIRDIYSAALDAALEAGAKSARRLDESQKKGIRAVAAALLFETAREHGRD